jgi:hypothetical protein
MSSQVILYSFNSDAFNSEIIKHLSDKYLYSKNVEKQYSLFSIKSDKMIVFRAFCLRTFFNTFTADLISVKF